jgi:hypothetical protein
MEHDNLRLGSLLSRKCNIEYVWREGCFATKDKQSYGGVTVSLTWRKRHLKNILYEPFNEEAHTALFKDPVRTAL